MFTYSKCPLSLNVVIEYTIRYLKNNVPTNKIVDFIAC